MQLAITILNNANIDAINELILMNSTNQCRIIDLKSSVFGELQCAYLLIEGNWNQLSKYESTLHAIEKKYDVKIHSARIEKNMSFEDLMPYSIEIVGLESSDIISKAILFFTDRHITIEEVNAHRYRAPYLNAQLLSARFVIACPKTVSLFQIREDLALICDEINADLFFEPFRANN
jgi:glycine cleavage system transcriptional repressor